MTTLKIKEIIGTPNAILHKLGLQLFEKVDALLKDGEKIIISFDGINNLTSGFMNASVGKLYKNYGVQLDQMVSFIDITDNEWRDKLEDAKTLALNPEKARIIDNAISDLFD